MTIRLFTYTLLAVSLFFTGCKEQTTTPAKNTTAQSKRPNIIFIMDDQHRWDALGIVDSIIKTPTLDSLAKNGVFFREAVCQAPMCVPSRNSIMFGLYPNQTGVYRNSGGVADSLLPGKTMAQYFKDSGYETAGFGKTHWGRYKTDTRGFETRYTSEIPEKGGKSMAELNPEAKARYDAEVAAMGPGEENNLGYLGFTSKLPESEHRDGWITDRALEYIEKREDERPLFFYLSYMKPHAGHNVPEGYEDLYDLDEITYAQQPPWDEDYSPHAKGVNRRDLYEEYWKNATDEDWKLMTMRYYANVTWIDDMMGRTLRALRKKGLLDNAIIVYTSDHGEMLGEHYYRFNKYNLYESSVRVPLILAGNALPEAVQKGSVSKRPTENVDILPTLLELAGIPQNKPLPGSNLLKEATKPASFSALHEREGEAAFMWRTENHKLILVLERKDKTSAYSRDAIITGEFYNLAEDPREWNDLYGKASVTELQERYTDQLLTFLQQMKP
ncbi:sulfatase family protein [Leeuwenhoekiella parthenopeia]|uniref:Sulfatase-like hydrolase/transferase n=1 Tax=Leeuwenhoekiella parthenopeia TaxID=2890320 RepID=A0ABS8GNF4_9FLAO|nr:sulfatase-like hydrolase/transferase [Leeuwenhoekiella parthenopeia]MCC4211517.1 sulfatase-like hydrolase/transferase [Leeuwenhoekiella parthenopeia]